MTRGGWLLVALLGAGLLWIEHQQRDELRLVRQELAALRERPPLQLTSVVAAPLRSERAVPAPSPSPSGTPVVDAHLADVPAPAAVPAHLAEPQQALDSAQHTVTAALARGRWTSNDVDELRTQLASAHDPAAARELARQVMVALNRQQLVVEDPTMRLFP
jgi:hypothetical protein